MNRKKFFTSITVGTLGFTIFNSFPLRLIHRKSNFPNSKVNIKPNPLAVSRNPKGEKNV